MQKIAVITGGSVGIGRAISEKLAKNKYKVIATYNKSKIEAEKLKNDLKKKDIYLDIIELDVTKSENVKKVIQNIYEKYGRIDVLVNNAGISEYKMFCNETREDWDRIINTNLYSAFVISQEVSKIMVNQKEGTIINISSIWGNVGSSMEVIYSISKAGMNGMTKALAKELGPSNIRVNAIAPGIINTKMNENIKENEKEMILEEIPLGKIGDVEEIAKCVNWLVEDTYTTGQIISINGGWSIT